jgi:hypothetical protein
MDGISHHSHVCPGFGAHGTFFWLFVILIPFAFTALVGYCYYRRSGLAQGLVASLVIPLSDPYIDIHPRRKSVCKEREELRTGANPAL